jgi:hypothetical protein
VPALDRWVPTERGYLDPPWRFAPPIAYASLVATHPSWSSLPAIFVIAVGTACSSDAAPEPALDRHDATTGSENRDAAQSPVDATSPLPAATKGYELYARDESGALAFTLITGTNRLKTVAEIVAPSADVEDGEWVVLRGDGLEALERVLARVPAGTSVVLGNLEGLPALSASGRSDVVRVLAASGR